MKKRDTFSRCFMSQNPPGKHISFYDGNAGAVPVGKFAGSVDIAKAFVVID
jgi:hypothetical protein